jgi:conjugal transfer pilus assembly protein TraB
MSQTKEALSNALIHAKQKKLLILAIMMGALIGLPILNHVTGSWETPKTKEKKQEKTSLVTSLDSIPAEDIWQYKSESRLDTQDDAIKDLQKEIDRIGKNGLPGQTESQVNEALEARLLQLEEMLATMRAEQTKLPITGGQNFPGQAHSSGGVFPPREVYQEETFIEPTILSLQMGLKPLETSNMGRSVDNFIPVGSFAKSVLLTGVDAPAAVSSADNPVPMLLKIVDNAVLPRGLRGEIDTCHVTASAYGEISEERVRVRLDKISCTYLDGRVFVDNIDGYVTGEDGKSGIRGKVVWREGALLTRSFAAGFLGGVSQGIGDAAGETSTSPLGTVQSYPGSELFQQGVGTGAGSALNKLSEYYIKRAEQYHPVIEVEAGRLVDIVISTRKDSKSHGLNLVEGIKQ